MVGRSLYAWFAWLPVIILWAFLILIIPFLGLIAFVVAAFGAVAALGALAARIVAAFDAYLGFVFRGGREPRETERAKGAGSRDVRVPRPGADGLTAQAHTAIAQRRP
jgi:hypothetical protein